MDVDALKKSYNYSTNPIYLVMETPEQQMQDQLDSERKIRRTLQRQLQQREDELEALKESNRISMEEYQQDLQKLYANQQNNEQLIADMAKEYAQMDYDQMDELNQRISDAILNGCLTEADSLLRSKGDMKSRVAEIRREQQSEAKRETEIAQEQAALAEAKAGTQKRLEDIASDCQKFFDLCKLNMQWDSAAYYIETRADLDTTNTEWQFDAAYFFQEQNDFNRAEKYYLKALEIRRRMVKATPQAYSPDLVGTLNNFGNLYSETQRYTESETMYLEALEICRRLAQATPQTYEPDVAMTLNNLGILYKNTQRLTESETMYLETLEIYRRLAQFIPQVYESDLAGTLNNLGNLYSETQRYTESETMYLEALEIYRRLAQATPQTYEPDVAMTLNNLGILYKASQHLTESETMLLEALEIRRRLAKANPQAYEPDVAGTLNNLGNLYSDTQRYMESETTYFEAMEIYRRLAQSNPQAYEPHLARTLNNLGDLYSDIHRFTESEAMYLEALEIRRRLSKANTQVYEPNLATTLYNIGLLYIQQQQYHQAIEVYEGALMIYRKLKVSNPSYDYLYHYSLYWLIQLYSTTDNHSRYYEINEEWLPIVKRDYQEDAESYQEDYVKALDSQSFLCIFVGQLEQSEQYAREALSLDAMKHSIASNLAAALLLQGKYAEAEAIYRQYKDELKDSFLGDFEEFEEAGVIPEERKADVERIKKMLNE